MYAFATLVMGGDKYVPGAICLAKSLRRFYCPDNGRYELVCMVTPEVPVDDLEGYFDRIVEVPALTVKAPTVGGYNASKIYHWNSSAPTKWNILQLTTYEKVLFLDADMVVEHPIDELFTLRCPAACFDHQITDEYGSDPRWSGRRVPGDGRGFTNWYKVFLGLEDPVAGSRGHLDHGRTIPRPALDALRTHSNSQFALQGGIVLVEPSQQLYAQFRERMQGIADSLQRTSGNSTEPTDRTLSAIDELTLTLFYHDRGDLWTHVDIRYNVSAYHLYAMWRERTDPEPYIKVLHYISSYKPWFTRPDGRSEREYLRQASEDPVRNRDYRYHHEVAEKWWSIYES